MADLSKKIARIDVVIGGVEAAKNALSGMKKEAKSYKKELEALSIQLQGSTGDPVKYDEIKKKYAEIEVQLKSLQKSIRETENATRPLDELLQDISGQTLRTVNSMRKSLGATLLGINPKKDADAIREVQGYIKQVSDEIARRKGTLVEFSDIIGRIGTTSDKSLGMARQRLQELIATTDKSSDELKIYEQQLKQVIAEEQKRAAIKADATMNNLPSSSVQEIQDAIKATTQLRDAQTLGSKTWQDFNTQIQNANNYLKTYDDQVKKASSLNVVNNLDVSSVQEINQAIEALKKLRDQEIAGSQEWNKMDEAITKATQHLKQFEAQGKEQAMLKQFSNLSNLSKSALDEQKKYWQEVLDNAEPYSAQLDDAKRKLEAIATLDRNRMRGNAIQIIQETIERIGTTSDKSLGMARQRLQELIATTDKSSDELKVYEQQLKQVITEEQKRAAIKADATMNNLPGSSVQEIQDAIKATTQLRDAQTLGSKTWQDFNTQIQNANNYLKTYDDQVKKASSLNVVNNLDVSSVQEINQAIEALKKLRDQEIAGSQEWNKMDEAITKATQHLKQFEAQGKEQTMLKQFSNLSKLSRSALDEQKKYWQEVLNNAEPYSAQLDDAKRKLEAITELDKQRMRGNALQTIQNVEGGNFDKTIAETKDAIKLINEYKQTLKTTDVDGIRQADEAIEKLNASLKETTQSTISYADALHASRQVGQGTYTGTYEELEKVKKALEEYKKQLRVGDTAKLEEINLALQDINKATDKAKTAMVDIRYVIDHIRTVPLEELQRAAKQLEEELTQANRNTRAYIETSAKLRQVNSQIKQTTKMWEDHDNVILKTVKRLASYVLVYAGFNEVVGQIKNVTRANLELSDSMADIQKTTGLTAKQVAELGKAIDSIDTRTTQKELYDLAYEAGKLGISAQEDVLSFVKAGNQLLVALGEDLGGAEAIKDLMKINAVLGETTKLGVERALLATGSAINEVGQNSTASEGYLVDFAQRLSGVAAQSGLTMAQLIALGGTADALGQNVEVSATALSKFIITLQTNTRAVAAAAGLSEETLKGMLETGNTMDAIEEVFKGLSRRGGIAELAPIMGDLGSEGARMVQVLAAMASNTAMLHSQLYIATEGFKEATSITNEYNVKNEDAMAILLRMGNAIKELFVNSTFVGWLKEVLYNISLIPSWIERNYTFVRILTSALAGMVTQLILARAGFIGWIRSINAAKLQAFGSQIIALAKSLFTVTTYTNGLKTAWTALGKAFSANAIGLILNALAAVVTYMIAFKDQVEEGIKTMTDFSSQVIKETTQLNNLRAAIERANTENGERAALIQKLNSKYEKYLGFMVTENNYAKNQKYIYDLLNASIRETIALKMQEKLTENVMDKYTGPLQKSIERISDALSLLPGIGEESASEAIRIISKSVAESIENGGDAYANAMEALKKKYGEIQPGTEYYNLTQGILSYTKVQKNMNKEIGFTINQLKGETDAAKELRVELQKQKLQEMQGNILESNDILEIQNYISIAGQYMSTLDKTGQAYQSYATTVAKAKERLDKISTSGDNIWGVGATIETASPSKLAATYKDMEDRIKALNVDAKDYEKMVEKYEEIRDQALRELNRRGRNEKGNLLKQRTGGINKDLVDQRKAIKSRLAEFEAIYKDYQQQLSRQYNEGLLTETSYNNQMLANDLAYYQDRQDILQDFLDGRTKIISRSGKDISAITDEALRSELAKNISTDAAKSEEALKKMSDKIDKSLLSVMDKVLKMRQHWADKLEQSGSLGLVSDMGISKTEQADRMKAIESFYADMNRLTDEELRERLSIDALYGDKAKNLTKAQLDALREQYGNYYDEMNKLAIQEADKEWGRVGGPGERHQNAQAGQERNIRFESSLQSLGLATEDMVEDSELQLLRMKYKAAEDYYNLIREKGGESLEASRALADARAAIEEQEIEIQQRKLETMKEYTDAVISFGEQMGEAAFSEVSDRKEAAKQLLQTTMKLTNDLIMQEVKRMLMKKTIKKQEVSLEASTQQQITVAQGGSMISSLEATQAATQGDVTAGIASGAAKTIGKLGWWGIPLIAIISALLNGLMGTVLGSITKSKSEVAAATGAGSGRRMATGMLTYAKGDYPVLGNDGQVYNARYQKELKTGVYTGGAHFGIFSEKKPEMIVDGDTTQKLIVNYPHLYDAITTIARHGRLKNAMPTFAAGDYPAGMANIAATATDDAVTADEGNTELLTQMQATLEMATEVNRQLLETIKQGKITANINPYTNYDAQKKANRFMQKRGIN